MFVYPELVAVSCNDQRWYLTPSGLYYPSVTTVLGHTAPPEGVASLQRWRHALGAEAADEVARKAALHGTNVHLLAERYLKKQEVLAPIDGQPVPELDAGAFNALKLQLQKIDEIWGQEVTLYSIELEVAGRTDLVGMYRGVPAIVDFKTASKVRGPKDVDDYRLQLCFYGEAHNSMFDTDIQDGFILMVSELGFPQEFHVKLNEHREALKKRATSFWQAAINSG